MIDHTSAEFDPNKCINGIKEMVLKYKRLGLTFVIHYWDFIRQEERFFLYAAGDTDREAVRYKTYREKMESIGNKIAEKLPEVHIYGACCLLARNDQGFVVYYDIEKDLHTGEEWDLLRTFTTVDLVLRYPAIKIEDSGLKWLIDSYKLRKLLKD